MAARKQEPYNEALFKEVVAKRWSDQAKFFLNAYWAEHGKEAENIWTWTQKLISLDSAKGKEGSDLDEFWSHKFMETLGEPLTVIQMREQFREIDLDFNKRMSLIEFLVYKFRVSVKELLARPQGTNEDLVKAQRALEEVQNEIEKIEKKKAELEAKSAGGGVKAMQAKNELQQLLTQDPTDLNRALLTAEAAVRKAQKLGGVAAQGALWWVDRELIEAKKYKPQRKQ
eukprot:TRINITY_DN1163_c0_g1_i1.p1 TRINITY_DN1163_c0_g1~~TRINITY_DN1163_c0_g1_i1.p1  ORF type:complete len:240 (-),score=89.43 TRINITY_DN1163_c0_g1_i1:131-814(-)